MPRVENEPRMSKAEVRFREAFVRLIDGNPVRLPKGASVSVANVGRESGLDPSALKKSRFPELVEEIQKWAAENPGSKETPTARQRLLANRASSRELKERLRDVQMQRDRALAKCVLLESKVLELTLELGRLNNALPQDNIVTIASRRRTSRYDK